LLCRLLAELVHVVRIGNRDIFRLRVRRVRYFVDRFVVINLIAGGVSKLLQGR
jgi:hypothetical protein